jgi:hypothetical protein
MKKLTNGWLSAVCVISILALHNCCKGSLTYDGATAELKFAAREPQPVRRPQIPPCPSSRSLWRPPSTAAENACGISLGRLLSRTAKGEIVCVGTVF